MTKLQTIRVRDPDGKHVDYQVLEVVKSDHPRRVIVDYEGTRRYADFVKGEGWVLDTKETPPAAG